ncbi:MAG: hypothetical protein M3444_21355 [Acidobacteriota bacterium]|nr:hypothetical protein [Acidobacteriota bacterium]MDQ5838797.1 hypothetical protein [Acidobacteriota bacterium]
MTTTRTQDASLADCVPFTESQSISPEGNGDGVKPPDRYSEALVEHWAEALVDGPMKTITRYDKTAKLLATVVTPLQAVLFAAYDQVWGKMNGGTPLWFTEVLLVLFVISVAGVLICVTYVCNERPRLKIKLHGLKTKRHGVISSLLDGNVDLSSAVESWEDHIEYVTDCKHRWLMGAYWCFIAGSGVAVAVLIVGIFIRAAGGSSQ